MALARILIVDPSPLVRERMVMAVIRALGQARVEEAVDALEAAEALNRAIPDVVLFDAALSIGALAELIERSQGNDGVSPRFLVLASDATSYRAPCLASGATDVVDRSDADAVVRSVKAALAAGFDPRPGIGATVPPTAFEL